MKKFFALYAAITIIIVLTGCATLSGCTETADITPLRIAVEKGDVKTTKILLDQGTEFNKGFSCGLYDVGGDCKVNALFCAAHAGQIEVAKVLIEKGADVNVKGSIFGRTPLTAAVYARHEGIVKLLIENGADVDYAMRNIEKISETKDGAMYLTKVVKDDKKDRAYQPLTSTPSNALPTALPLPTESAAPF